MLIAVVLIGVVVLAAARAGRSGGGAGAWRVPALVVGVIVVLFFVVVGRDSGSGGGGRSPDAPAQVTLLEPLDATRVVSPVAVTIDATNVGDGHLHVVIDHPCVPVGRVIASDASHRHLEPDGRHTELDLPEGQHSLCVQVGDKDHRAGEARDEVTILVGTP
jgi:hypothetical protein